MVVATANASDKIQLSICSLRLFTKLNLIQVIILTHIFNKYLEL